MEGHRVPQQPGEAAARSPEPNAGARERAVARILRTACLHLEANAGAYGHAQIIVRAIIEVNQVSNVTANSNWPGIKFNSATGIEGAIHIVAAQRVN